LDSFISPIPGFEGDIPIHAIPILAHDPGIESSEDPATRSSASASRTRACKQKTPIDPSPHKKAKKAVRKPLGGIKISGTKQKVPASTPQLGIRKGIPILRSKTYTYLEYFFYRLSGNPWVSMQSAPRYPPSILRHPEVAPQFPSPKPTKHPEASLENPESFGLEAPGRREFGEGSSVLRSGKQPRQYSRVAEFLWGNPDFIQARFHIGWYISAFVNSEAERGQIKVLYSSMKSTSELIDVIIFTPYYPFCLKI
jgi:hypothetical protein